MSLPWIDPADVRRVGILIGSRSSVAPKVFVLVVLRQRLGVEWWDRRDIAAHIGTKNHSPFGIDAALRHGLDRGWLSDRTSIKDTRAQRLAANAIARRLWIPADRRLIEAVHGTGKAPALGYSRRMEALIDELLGTP